MYTVYDRIFGNFPALIPYIHRVYMVLVNPTYERTNDAVARAVFL
jgi:hypothetical protein